MAMDPRFAPLFEPVRIGPVTAPNRFVSVPHAVGHSALEPHGAIGIRATRAEGGWGIVAMQLCDIDPTSDISTSPIEKMWDDGDIRTHAWLTAALHERGALAAIELGHTGIRSRGIGTGCPPMGPSARPILKPELPINARAMDRADIAGFRASHRAAVRRAIAAGYDIVYVYAAHDASLLWHFLSPAYNARSDEYGGSFENRLRLLREVLEEAREEAEGRAAVALRFAVHELSGPRAITSDGEGRDTVEALAELPDLWDVNVSGWSRDSATSRFEEEGFQERHIAFVKTVTTRPVLGVGRFTSPDAMLGQIRRGVLDLIGAARPSIADPFLPRKIRDGRVEDIRECIGCNICVASDSLSVHLRCSQNPTVSEEWRRGWHPEIVPAASCKAHMLIVGSGVAGLEAALVLARAGHRVTLAERSAEFGGRVSREARLPGLAAWARLRDYRLYQLRQMGNVDLFAESELDAAAIAELGADQVALATGSVWMGAGEGRSRFAPLPGFAGVALTPDDIMAGAPVQGTVVILDDDHYYMGNVLAVALAQRGHQVHLVCPAPVIAGFMAETLEQPRVIAELVEHGVRLYPNTTATGWTGQSLSVVRSDTGEALPEIAGATLVTVGARRPEDGLSAELAASGIAHRVIGDAEAPGTLQAAIYSGHRHTREMLGTEPASRLFRRERPERQE